MALEDLLDDQDDLEGDELEDDDLEDEEDDADDGDADDEEDQDESDDNDADDDQSDDDSEDSGEDLDVDSLIKDDEDEDDDGDKKVPLAALHEERRKNRELREKLKKQESEGGEADTDNKDEQDELSRFLDEKLSDDLVSGSDVKVVISEALKIDRKLREKDEQRKQAKAVEESLAAAEKTYTPSKVGKSLAFASVIELGMDNLSRKDEMEIRSAENPGRELYRRCILKTPSLLKIAKLQRSPGKKIEKKESSRTNRSTRRFASKPMQPETAAGQLYNDLMS